jgi:hypothetical protein
MALVLPLCYEKFKNKSFDSAANTTTFTEHTSSPLPYIFSLVLFLSLIYGVFNGRSRLPHSLAAFKCV